MRRVALILPLVGGLLALAACAGDADDVRYRELGRGGFGRGGGGDPLESHQGEALNLFISPSGKPYRASLDRPYPVTEWFATANTAHDGKLTPAEFRKDAEAFFRELDTDHDGVIDGFEVQAYEQKVAPEILPRVAGLVAGEGLDMSLGHRGDGRPEIGGSRAARRGGGAAADRRPEGAGLFGLLNEPEPVAADDADFNGKITLEEFLAAADRRFAALDTKGRGYLTLADLPKTPAQIAIERIAERRAKAAAKTPKP